MLAFKPQIQNYIERDVRFVPVPAGHARLGVQALLERVRAERPDAQPASVTENADARASAAVALGRDGTVYVDPYTGRVLGGGSQATTALTKNESGLPTSVSAAATESTRNGLSSVTMSSTSRLSRQSSA